MKKRIKKWFKYIIIKYIPSSNQLAVLEANRLSNFITENYDCNQQLIILDELKEAIIEYRKNQIILKQLEIEENKKEEIDLQRNLVKLLAQQNGCAFNIFTTLDRVTNDLSLKLCIASNVKNVLELATRLHLGGNIDIILYLQKHSDGFKI